MSIRKASSRTTVNSGVGAAAASTPNQILVAPVTATTVVGGGSIGGTAITNVSIMSDATFSSVLSGDTAISTAGGYITITGSGFKNGANVYINSSVVSATVVSSSQINATVPALSAGSYNLFVFNSDGSGASYSPGIVTSGPPTWTTTTYTSSTLSVGFQLVASGDAPLTYYIKEGSANPQNFTVNSTGYVSGTASAEGSYTITVIVDDAQSQSTQADITIAIELADPYFKYTTLLLTADGANNANNHSFIDSTSSQLFTRVGNPTQGSFSPFSQSGWSNYFDGTGDSLTWTGTTVGAGAFSCEFFIFSTNGYSSMRAPIGVAGTGSTNAFEVRISSATVIQIGKYNVSLTSFTVPTLKAYTWHHIVLCRDSSNRTTVFVDGTRSSTGAVTLATDFSAATSRIGQLDGGANAGEVTGYISDVRLIVGSTPYDPTQSTITVPTSKLTAVSGTQLLTCQDNRFKDNSTNNFTITGNGDAAVVPFSPFAPTAAYSTSTVGGSGYFDGSGDSITRTVGSTISLTTSEDYTLEAFAYANAISDARCIFFTRPGASGYTFILRYAGTTMWQLYFPGGNTAYTFNGSNSGFKQWVHHAIVRRSGTLYWYINGTQVYSVANSTSTSDTYLEVGNYAAYYWNGYISNFRFVKGTAVYTGNFTPPTAPLTAITNTQVLLNFTNAGIIDYTGRNIIETVSNAKVSTAVSKYGGGSVALDGTEDYLFFSPLNNNLYNFGTVDFTLEFWINPNVVNQSAVWLFNWNTEPRLQLTNQTLEWYSAGVARITSGNILTAGVWTHVALVRSNGVTKLYAGGTQTGSDFSDTTNYSQQIFSIGGGSPWFNGLLDDIRVTRGYARYVTNFTPPNSAHKLR